jgi:hypothetical protein
MRFMVKLSFIFMVLQRQEGKTGVRGKYGKRGEKDTEKEIKTARTHAGRIFGGCGVIWPFRYVRSLCQ